MNNSISLIGMAGAGKSSIGEKLAKQLNFNFVDSDLLMEEKSGKWTLIITAIIIFLCAAVYFLIIHK